MSSAKYFVRGGGRWREVDAGTGRVSGWGPVQFVSVRGGRLEVVRRSAVLRGLRALAAGTPTTVTDGPRLSQFRHLDAIEPQEKRHSVCQHHHACCQNTHQCSGDAKKILIPASTQCSGTVNAAIQVTEPTIRTNNEPRKRKSLSLKTTQNNYSKHQTQPSQLKTFVQTNTAGSPKKLGSKRKLSTSDSETSAIIPLKRKGFSDVKGKIYSKKSLEERKSIRESQKSNEPCKELLIDEEEILLLRKFIEKDDKNIFGVDLEKFDSDDYYKSIIFYKLNPLVCVERSTSIVRMLRDKQSQSSSVSLKEFVNMLGLQSIEERSSRSSSKYRLRARNGTVGAKRNREEICESETDKENFAQFKQNRSKVRRVDKILSESDREEARKKVTKAKDESKRNRAVGLVGQMTSKPQRLSRKKDVSVTIEMSSDSENVFKPVRRQADVVVQKMTNLSSPKRKDKLLVLELSSDSEDAFKVRAEKRSQVKNADKVSPKGGKLSPKVNKVTSKVDKVSSNVEKVSSTVQKLSPSLRKLSLKKGSNVVGENSNGGATSAERGPTVKRGGRGLREYSRLEDEAIVQWLRSGGRARRVNGNHIWTQCAPHHERVTGLYRSWHSLRNRYLRYLLPTLGSMSLPPHVVSTLRAAAAQGSMAKSQKHAPRGNSMFREEPVRSAWSRRPRAPPSRETPSPTSSPSSRPPSPPTSSSRTQDASPRKRIGSPKAARSQTRVTNTSARKLRSSAGTPTPPAHTRARTPTYSDLTRRFATTHRSTPDSDESTTEGHDLPPKTDTSVRRRSQRLADTIVKEATAGDTSVSAAHVSDTSDRPRTRRLYNPKAI